VERYPELKADQNFLNLQRNLIETEERIALARGTSTSSPGPTTLRIAQMPDRFLAGLGRMRAAPLMEASGLRARGGEGKARLTGGRRSGRTFRRTAPPVDFAPQAPPEILGARGNTGIISVPFTLR